MREHMPLSPNIRHYRPQLTSVLSILNRITGVLLGLVAIALVLALWATAAGPHGYEIVSQALKSPLGLALMVLATLAFFLHWCGGIRHLLWDAGIGFELRSIYIGGWALVIGGVLLTALLWIGTWLLAG